MEVQDRLSSHAEYRIGWHFLEKGNGNSGPADVMSVYGQINVLPWWFICYFYWRFIES
jgi:hypothetical protein